MPRAAVRPATLLLLVTVALLASAARIAGELVDVRGLVAAANAARYPPELQRLLASPRATRMARAKERCEAHLIDFAELVWPILEPEQPFVRTWVQEAICLHLEAVTDGRITNFLGNVPPGSTKSYLVNVIWPAWEWGPKNRPDLRYMSWSYSPDLTAEANEQCRKIIRSQVYQRYWGDRFQIVEDTDAKRYYKNDRGGWRRSSSVAGAGTGFRADRLIWDDPHNVRDADSPAKLVEATRWFSRTLPTRVRNASGNISKVKVPAWVRDVHGMGLEDDPDDGERKATISATIGIMQRVHVHDISGIVLKNPGLGYEILLIEMRYKGADHPARKLETWRPSTIGYVDPRTKVGELADPLRFPEEAVAKLEAQMMIEGGADAAAAQLDQWPLASTGEWFKVEWLPIIEPHEVPKSVPRGKRGWDLGGGGTSPTADPSASARLARGPVDRKFYLWHTATKRGDPGDHDKFMADQHRDDPRDVDWSVPEDPGTGKRLASYIVRDVAAGRYVHTSSEQKNKIVRAKPVSAQAKHGNFVVVRHPGCEQAIAELVDFPYGDHDDVVDAISRAFDLLIEMPGTVTDTTPIIGTSDDVPPPLKPGVSTRYDFDL